MGLQQLGAQVTLLAERELASADLSQYDTIMTGTRAYAVREDLKTYNSRLLDYVSNGGNMVVLYNTQELVPNTFAPFPGELPRSAEEVSEEDSPVPSSRPRISRSPGRTRSPAPTSTAGSSSEGRSSSRSGTRRIRR